VKNECIVIGVNGVWFLQGIIIACYVEPCISYGRLSVRLSVRHTLALQCRMLGSGNLY